MSEFPWEQAEASKQLEEKVTLLPASLQGGLAKCPPPHSPRSHSWAWTAQGLCRAARQGLGMTDGGRNGAWPSRAMTTSPSHSTTSRGSPPPSKEMQAWHSRLLTLLPRPSQLLLVFSSPRHIWTFPVSAKQLPTACSSFSYVVCLSDSY